MKYFALLLILLSFSGFNSYAQKMAGFGGELSILSIRPCATMWISKSTGFEVFAGQSAELGDFKPNDLEAGFKFLRTIIYNRTDRTYFGITGKWKWVNVYDQTRSTSLPVPGLLIGKEWYSKRIHRKAFAIELGYQVGSKEHVILSPATQMEIGKETYEEFPLILNLRYTFYKRR